MLLLIEYPKCTTCQKARKWLEEQGYEFECRDIKGQNPTYEELKTWHRQSALPLSRFFNTSGLVYRSLNLKERLPAMSEDEQLRLLSTDGMLLKRPLLIDGDRVMVAFCPKEWEEKLGNR